MQYQQKYVLSQLCDLGGDFSALHLETQRRIKKMKTRFFALSLLLVIALVVIIIRVIQGRNPV